MKKCTFQAQKQIEKNQKFLWVKFPTFTFYPTERPRMIFHRRQCTKGPCWSWLSGWTTWHVPTPKQPSRFFSLFSHIVC
jgi:hypothetical protein